jgi:hypothetical protein
MISRIPGNADYSFPNSDDEYLLGTWSHQSACSASLITALLASQAWQSKSKLLYDWWSVSQSECLGIEHPCGTCDQILLPVGVLLSEICGLVSIERLDRITSNLWVSTSQRTLPFRKVWFSLSFFNPIRQVLGLNFGLSTSHPDSDFPQSSSEYTCILH